MPNRLRFLSSWLFPSLLCFPILFHLTVKGWCPESTAGSSLGCIVAPAAKASGKRWPLWLTLCDCLTLWSPRLDWLPRKPECCPKINTLCPGRRLMSVWSVITARCYLLTQECILPGGLPDYPPNGFTSNFLRKIRPCPGKEALFLPDHHWTHSGLAHARKVLLLMLPRIRIRLCISSLEPILILGSGGSPPTLAYDEEWFRWWALKISFSITGWFGLGWGVSTLLHWHFSPTHLDEPFPLTPNIGVAQNPFPPVCVCVPHPVSAFAALFSRSILFLQMNVWCLPVSHGCNFQRVISFWTPWWETQEKNPQD